MEAIEKFGRLIELQKEKEQLLEEKERIVAKWEAILNPLKDQLNELQHEEDALRNALIEEALQNGQKKVTPQAEKATLAYPGLGSVSVTKKEVYEITDLSEAEAIIKENVAFLGAQKIGLNKKAFVEIALDIYQQTGQMVQCVDKVPQVKGVIRLQKMEEEEEA